MPVQQKEFSFFSPAKVNLFFRVLKRRENGYHEITSLIQMLDFGDTLFFSLDTPEDHFTSSSSHLTWDDKNLIFKATNIFRKVTGIYTPVRIHLEKRIPMQSGLGGGSSNAATTLYALNHLLDTQLSDSDLAALGANLGADVPCFFGLGRVHVQGIGEIVSSIAPSSETYTLIQPPHTFLATPLVYQHVNLNQCSQIPPEDLLAAFANNNPIYINDLEHAAFSISADLADFKNHLNQTGYKGCMTGSGSCFVIEGHKSIETQGFSVKASALDRIPSAWYQSSLFPT